MRKANIVIEIRSMFNMLKKSYSCCTQVQMCV